MQGERKILFLQTKDAVIDEFEKADDCFSQGSWLPVMYGQGIVPTGHNPLHDLQNMDQITSGFDQIAGRWRQTVERMPAHDDFLKARGMGADAD